MRAFILLLTGTTLLVSPSRLVAQPPIEAFWLLVSGDSLQMAASDQLISEYWDDSHASILVELMRYVPDEQSRRRIISALERGTGQRLGRDLEGWWEWIWRTDPGTHPEYAAFKAELYATLDPSFEEYFDDDPAANIRLDEIRWGGVGRDGIPPLDHPKMIAAAEAAYLEDDNVVFGIALDGDVRAYPKRILAWHEMFKDSIAGEHYTGAYCTLCGTMILYRSAHEGVHHELGTSGFLYRSNKLMYDHATRSLWSTFAGEPAVGPLVGQGIRLDPRHVVTTTWGEWRRRHPGTLVLSLDTGHERDYGEGVAYRQYFATDRLMFGVPKLDPRLRNKDEVLALRFPDAPGEQLAIWVVVLSRNRVYHDSLGDTEFVVLTDASGASRVYESASRRFTGWDSDSTAWDDSGAQWAVTEGGLVGPAGERLERLPAHRAFWFGWYAQYPETRLVRR
ncbi:MAG: DUF3179 domain-containing protein [Gemmatimonadetes bacterium]|nr:DUF3179 domain-containing protein [Gemmatimonadota bacterium]MYC91119.1 DUF3179 domain-containing protein [Gemmatimonadota bacterium]MYJ16706.1 DUF3179 domain-containing protein [Gemmatimonadota bacterium]